MELRPYVYDITRSIVIILGIVMYLFRTPRVHYIETLEMMFIASKF